MTDKIIAFDYIVDELLKWWVEETGLDILENDLSKLKAQKLLFFVVAFSSNKNDRGLLYFFDNFEVRAYGHFEKDVENNLHLSSFEFTTKNVKLKDNFEINLEDNLLKNYIDETIIKFKTTHKNLIKLSPFSLVDINFRWQSYKTMLKFAKSHKLLKTKVPYEMIMRENKIFIESIY